MNKGTLATACIFPSSTRRKISADAPLGLRKPATSTFVSKIIIILPAILRLFFQLGNRQRMMPNQGLTTTP
jgi:hypothetical protein